MRVTKLFWPGVKFSESCDPIRLACMTYHCTHHLQNTLSAKATAPLGSETCVRDVSTPAHEMQYRRPTYEVEMFDNFDCYTLLAVSEMNAVGKFLFMSPPIRQIGL